MDTRICIDLGPVGEEKTAMNQAIFTALASRLGLPYTTSTV